MIVNNTTNNLPVSANVDLKKRRSVNPHKTDNELVQIFWTAPLEAFFGQETIAPVTNRSLKTLECDRWRGLGIPYRKVGGRVLYQKKDVVHWLESHELVISTSQIKGAKHD